MSVISRRLSRADGTTADGLSLEPMRRRHLRAIMPIEHSAYDVCWSRSVFESELAQVSGGTRYYVVARRRKVIVGYAGLLFVPDPDGAQAHVTNIAVAGSHRRQRVATRLMLDLAREAIGRGCGAWTLEVRASSTGAQEMYRRFGFAPAGVRKRYYNGKEDAIVMWCHDIDGAEYPARLAELEESA